MPQPHRGPSGSTVVWPISPACPSPKCSRPPITTPPPTPVPNAMHTRSQAPRPAPSRSSARVNARTSFTSVTGTPSASPTGPAIGRPTQSPSRFGSRTPAPAVEVPGQREPAGAGLAERRGRLAPQRRHPLPVPRPRRPPRRSGSVGREHAQRLVDDSALDVRAARSSPRCRLTAPSIPVHGQHGTGDERRAREIQDRLGDVVGAAEARRSAAPARPAGPRIRREDLRAGAHRGRDQAGATTLTADPLRRVGDGHRAGESDNRALGAA